MLGFVLTITALLLTHGIVNTEQDRIQSIGPLSSMSSLAESLSNHYPIQLLNQCMSDVPYPKSAAVTVTIT